MKIKLQGRQGELERLCEVRAESAPENTAVNDEGVECLTFLVDGRGADADDLTVHGDGFPAVAFVLVLFLVYHTRTGVVSICLYVGICRLGLP